MVICAVVGCSNRTRWAKSTDTRFFPSPRDHRSSLSMYDRAKREATGLWLSGIRRADPDPDGTAICVCGTHVVKGLLVAPAHYFGARCTYSRGHGCVERARRKFSLCGSKPRGSFGLWIGVTGAFVALLSGWARQSPILPQGSVPQSKNQLLACSPQKWPRLYNQNGTIYVWANLRYVCIGRPSKLWSKRATAQAWSVKADRPDKCMRPKFFVEK